MNKLIIDNVDELSDLIIHEDTDLVINLKDTNGFIDINVIDNICLRVLEFGNNTKNDVIYTLGENSKVIVNKMSINTSDKVKINLNGSFSNIIYNTSIINDCDNTYYEYISHNASNTISKISNHAINKNEADFVFDIDAKVYNNSDNCNTVQDNKIINKSCGKNIIKPNLLVDNNLIDATHSAYVGGFDPNSIFYLKTRGLDNKKIDELLSRGFLLEKMDLSDSEKEKVELIIKEYIQGGEVNE